MSKPESDEELEFLDPDFSFLETSEETIVKDNEESSEENDEKLADASKGDEANPESKTKSKPELPEVSVQSSFLVEVATISHGLLSSKCQFWRPWEEEVLRTVYPEVKEQLKPKYITVKSPAVSAKNVNEKSLTNVRNPEKVIHPSSHREPVGIRVVPLKLDVKQTIKERIETLKRVRMISEECLQIIKSVKEPVNPVSKSGDEVPSSPDSNLEEETDVDIEEPDDEVFYGSEDSALMKSTSLSCSDDSSSAVPSTPCSGPCSSLWSGGEGEVALGRESNNQEVNKVANLPPHSRPPDEDSGVEETDNPGSAFNVLNSHDLVADAINGELEDGLGTNDGVKVHEHLAGLAVTAENGEVSLLSLEGDALLPQAHVHLEPLGVEGLVGNVGHLPLHARHPEDYVTNVDNEEPKPGGDGGQEPLKGEDVLNLLPLYAVQNHEEGSHLRLHQDPLYSNTKARLLPLHARPTEQVNKDGEHVINQVKPVVGDISDDELELHDALLHIRPLNHTHPMEPDDPLQEVHGKVGGGEGLAASGLPLHAHPLDDLLNCPCPQGGGEGQLGHRGTKPAKVKCLKPVEIFTSPIPSLFRMKIMRLYPE